MTSFANFFRELHEEMQYQPSNAVFLYIVGKNLAKRNKQDLIDGMTKIETGRDIKGVVEAFKKAGIGELKLDSVDERKKEFHFSLKNSLFKTSLKRPTCSVVCGILASVVEETYGFYAGAMETACVSQGDKQCEFKAKVVGKEPLR
jgi:predicted hydrocarbon binding protein